MRVGEGTGVTFWDVVKGLQGRTVELVSQEYVPGTGEDEGELVSRVQFKCTDGYTFHLYVDYEDLDLAVNLVQE